jgi:hypothetical protein
MMIYRSQLDSPRLRFGRVAVRHDSNAEIKQSEMSVFPTKKTHCALKADDDLVLSLKVADPAIGKTADLQQKLLEVFQIPYKFKILSQSPLVTLHNKTPKETLERLGEVSPIALGDLHASVRKLVETLVVTNLVEMPLETARDFVALTKKLEHDKTLEEMRVSQDKLEKLIPQMKWKDPKRQLILIGDTISDRGPLDSITMDIIRHLRTDAKNPEAIILIASNHDHNVLRFLKTGHNTLRRSEQRQSLINTIALAETSENKDALPELIHNYYDYLKQAKLLYVDAHGTLYAHAPVTNNHIRNLIDLANEFPERFPTPISAMPQWTKETITTFIETANGLYHRVIQKQQEQTESIEPPKQTLEWKTWIGNFRRFLKGSRTNAKFEEGFFWTRKLHQDNANLPFADSPVNALAHGHHESEEEQRVTTFSKEPVSKGEYSVFNLDQNVRKHRKVPDISDEFEANFQSVLYTPCLWNSTSDEPLKAKL